MISWLASENIIKISNITKKPPDSKVFIDIYYLRRDLDEGGILGRIFIGFLRKVDSPQSVRESSFAFSSRSNRSSFIASSLA